MAFKASKQRISASVVKKFVPNLERRSNVAGDRVWYAKGIEFNTLQDVIDYFGPDHKEMIPMMSRKERIALLQRQESDKIKAELNKLEKDVAEKLPQDDLANADLQEEHAAEVEIDLDDSFTQGDQDVADMGDDD
jgi:hypothetical protein